MSDSSDKNREFVPVEDKKQGLLLIREAAKTIASTLVWTKNQEQTLRTHISLFSEEDQILYVWNPQEAEATRFMEYLVENNIQECYFSVSLSRANVFFKAHYVGRDAGGLKFRVPDVVYKVQRRTNMRVPIPVGYVLKVEFTDPLFPKNKLSHKVIDISAGGMAVLVRPEEEPHYFSGLELKDVTFTIRQKKIAVNGEVKHLSPLPQNIPGPGKKMGILFKGLRDADEQVIAAYVFEETRKHFSKFI